MCDVAIVMGSKSDWEVMKHVKLTLDSFEVPCKARVLSAHRTPEALLNFIKSEELSNTKIFIAGAGCAAHLAGVVASHTLYPVLGVPLNSSPLNGLDSLLSTVQMPSGMPVATFAIGKAGAVNAALFAVSILSVGDSNLHKKIDDFRKKKQKEILEHDLI